MSSEIWDNLVSWGIEKAKDFGRKKLLVLASDY